MNQATENDLFHDCALRAFIDALPLDESHITRSKQLAYRYYEETLCQEKK